MVRVRVGALAGVQLPENKKPGLGHPYRGDQDDFLGAFEGIQLPENKNPGLGHPYRGDQDDFLHIKQAKSKLKV